MGRKAFFKPSFTCEGCGSTKQHNIEFDFAAIIDQSKDGQQLISINVIGNIICRDCEKETEVRGTLTKFVNDETQV